MYTMQELHLFLLLSIISTSLSKVSLHSSTNLSTNLFLHVQFLQSKYSLKSHALLHSHSQLLGFQIKSLSPTPL